MLVFDDDDTRRIVEIYPYHDEAGVLLYEAVRFYPKTFRLRRPVPVGGDDWSVKGVLKVPYCLM